MGATRNRPGGVAHEPYGRSLLGNWSNSIRQATFRTCGSLLATGWRPSLETELGSSALGLTNDTGFASSGQNLDRLT